MKEIKLENKGTYEEMVEFIYKNYEEYKKHCEEIYRKGMEKFL